MKKFNKVFNVPKPIIGMIHVDPLPGTPKYKGNIKSIINKAISEAKIYKDMGIDSIAITYGMLGGFMTLVRPIAAFFTAIAVGITENIFGEETKAEEVKSCCATSSCGSKQVVVEKPMTEKLKEGFVYSFTDLFADIS